LGYYREYRPYSQLIWLWTGGDSALPLLQLIWTPLLPVLFTTKAGPAPPKREREVASLFWLPFILLSPSPSSLPLSLFHFPYLRTCSNGEESLSPRDRSHYTPDILDTILSSPVNLVIGTSRTRRWQRPVDSRSQGPHNFCKNSETIPYITNISSLWTMKDPTS
jgi:hypothetical protein